MNETKIFYSIEIIIGARHGSDTLAPIRNENVALREHIFIKQL